MGSDGEVVQAGSVRKRRHLIKEALRELGETGWSIDAIDGRPDTRLVKQLTPSEYQERMVARLRSPAVATSEKRVAPGSEGITTAA